MNPILALTFLMFGMTAPGTASAQTDAAESAEAVGMRLSEKLLSAMGGRDAWSRVNFVHVEAVHDDQAIAEPFTNRIWNDFTKPRVRFFAGNASFERARWISDGGGVREAAPGVLTPLTAAEYESDRSWWEANVYRTFQRMARRDASLSFRGQGSRLEIVKADGSVMSWFVLNQKGEPMLFGSGTDGRGSTFGPLATAGGVRYPKWGARADGSWRYEIVKFVAAEMAPADAFPAPATSK